MKRAAVLLCIVAFACAATAYSNGAKVARNGADNLHLAYQRIGKVCYSSSTDGGTSWLNAVELADPGAAGAPCIALNAVGQPCIAYPQSKTSYTTGLQFARFDGSSWNYGTVIPQMSMPGGFRLGPPSMAIDASDNVHLTVESTVGTPDGHWWYLRYYRFNANDPATVLENILLDCVFYQDAPAPPHLESPGLALDQLGNGHIAYTKALTATSPGDVYYAEQNADDTWKPAINLSQSETPSSEAGIDVFGDKVYATWTEDEVAGNQVYRNSKTLGDIFWIGKLPCSEIGTNGSKGAYNPFCASGIAGWVENLDNTYYAVKYLRPGATGSVELYRAAHYQSYPHGVLGSDGLTLNSIWTETLIGTPTAGPWISEVKFAASAGKKIAYLEVLAGTETPSVYTVYRDGYIAYPSGVSVDYANDELTYTLPYLVPGNDYTVQVVGYHESSSTWNEQVKLDGKEAKVLKVSAHVPETLLVNIPAGYYAGDGQITLSIQKLTGDYAAIASIAVYQSEKTTGSKSGGAQMAERTGDRGQMPVFKLQPSFPNPARNSATISYQIPKSGMVNLKVYNIQGQLVKTLVNGNVAAGAHTSRWDCRDEQGRQAANGIYLYQLMAGGNTATRKLVLVK